MGVWFVEVVWFCGSMFVKLRGLCDGAAEVAVWVCGRSGSGVA